MAREFKLIYEQMDQAYRRAFIDYAQGFALDNVVALLGISRNLALPAQGEVTFWLKKPPKADVAIATGTRVADTRGRLFKVTAPGRHPGDAGRAGVDGRHRGAHQPADRRPGARARDRDHGQPRDQAHQGGQALRRRRAHHHARGGAADDGADRHLPAEEPQVTVPVVALEAGPEGNLGSGTLTVMPTPPRGVDGGVKNEKPLTGGEAAEADEQLRERAKHALERAGNATPNAILYSVLHVDGVDSVKVLDQTIDPTIPPGEVWVRVSTGKPEIMPEVVDMVEKTRAAGIKARVIQVTSITLSGKFYVIPDTAGSSKDAYARYKRAVVSALGSLGIGEAVSARKLASLVFGIAGLADVAEAQLDYVRGSDPPAPVDKDPFVLKAEEQARPDDGKIDVVPVLALAATAASLAADGTLAITVQARDEADKPIRFRSAADCGARDRARQTQDGAEPAAAPGRRGGRHRDVHEFRQCRAGVPEGHRPRSCRSRRNLHRGRDRSRGLSGHSARLPASHDQIGDPVSFKTDRLVALFPEVYAARERDALLHRLLDASRGRADARRRGGQGSAEVALDRLYEGRRARRARCAARRRRAGCSRTGRRKATTRSVR